VKDCGEFGGVRREGTVAQALLQAVERIRPVIEQHAESAEANRRLSDSVYDAMYQAGLFAMLAPKAHEGLELHPVEAIQVWEAVARIDSAAAWNLVMNQAISAYAAWLPAEGVRELFRDGPPTTAGALNPPAAARRVEGGWRITGQVPFGSGCHNARWLAMPAVEMDGDRPKVDAATGKPKPFAVFFPRSEAEILDTWHTIGMRGTGSTDYAVHDLFVPDRMTAPVGPLGQPAPGFEGPLFRMWPWTAILGETTVSVGVAAEAVDQAVLLCRTKTAAYNVTPLREQQLVQHQMGKAKARVEASRDTLHRAASAAYGEVARSGAGLSSDAKIRLQLAVCFAAEACAKAVRFVNDAVGASSIRLEKPFQRHFRDAHVLLQHSSKSSTRYASAGRLMFGLENDWVWLSF
jgi:alkylation response protein AidB-like acyl-CoA dehydrogenase